MKCFVHSVVIMDEEQLKAEVFITVDNFIAIVILMAVLVRKKIATTVKKDFFHITNLILNVEICSFCMYFTF